MKFNSKPRFYLYFLAMMLGLWIPQVWAATIHSVAAGGNWSKAETWVGGQVPGEDDSVVVNGVVSVSYPTMQGLTVSRNSILQNDSSYNRTLTVNGDVINNGIIRDNAENGSLSIRVAGNIVNNGTWNNKSTNLIGTQARTTTGNPIQSLELRIANSDLSINNASIAFANKVYFDSELNLVFLNSNEITFSGEVYFSRKVTFPNSAKITFLGKVSNVVNILGEDLIFIYGGNESQEVENNTHNANAN
ncbi:MAG: hypothetical protein KAH84_02860 [Thiomargarita sp.]|nr:hypothetical protein [Thiomargarita sp.]